VDDKLAGEKAIGYLFTGEEKGEPIIELNLLFRFKSGGF